MISGKFSAPSIGRIYEDGNPENTFGAGMVNLGNWSTVYFTAESDANKIGPCFQVQGPIASGYIYRLSAWPVVGREPSSSCVLTITDEFGSATTTTISQTGSYQHTLSPAIYSFCGRLTYAIDSMGGPSRRLRIAVLMTDVYI